MRITKLFAVALTATALLASCSKDKDTDNGIVPNGGKTYARINLSQTANSTRAFQDNEPTVGTEADVKSVLLFIFDAEKKLEVLPVSFNMTDATNVAGSADGTKYNTTEKSVTRLVETTTGTHYFYVAINTPKALFEDFDDVIEVGATMAAVKEVIGTVAATSDLYNAANGFFMTNVTDPNGEVMVLADDTDAEAKNSVTLEVGRAFGKVSVDFIATATAQDMPNGILSNVSYRVLNNPVQMNLFPVWNAGLLKTPMGGAVNNLKWYENPNTGYNYFNEPLYKGADGQRANCYYLMENSNNGTGVIGSAAYVIVRGTYAPAVLYNPDGTAASAAEIAASDYATDGTFWRRAYTGSNGMITGYDTKYYIDVPQMALGSDELGVCYTKGICYYKIPLKNDHVGFTKANQGIYTVIRNNYFQVEITKVADAGETDGPGDGKGTNPDDNEDKDDDKPYTDPQGDPVTPPDKDPETPIDTTPTVMNAVIKVMKWSVVSQQEEL